MTTLIEVFAKEDAEAALQEKMPWEALSAFDILKGALAALHDRGVTRDAPGGERSAARAAAILTAWKGREVSEADVWQTLFAIKMARESQGAFNPDDYVDLAGYASLMGEHAARSQ